VKTLKLNISTKKEEKRDDGFESIESPSLFTYLCIYTPRLEEKDERECVGVSLSEQESFYFQKWRH
jgi:hypothetical protein